MLPTNQTDVEHFFSPYPDPKVLQEWLRLTVTGGLIAFTHKTSVAVLWEAEQERLELEAGLWEKVHVSGDIDYLPSMQVEPGKEFEEKAKVYIYRKV